MLNWEAIKTALKLFLITAVSALCLAFINKITAPVIAENQKVVIENTQRELIPEADTFIDDDILSLVEINNVEACYKAIKDDKVIGYIVTVVSKDGYGGDIRLMVGIDSNSQITKVKITETHETAGLGLKASDPEFIDQFVGRSSKLSVVKNIAPTSEGEDIAAISGATVTSKAVTNAVNTALEAVKSAVTISNKDVENIVNDITLETEKQIKGDD